MFRASERERGGEEIVKDRQQERKVGGREGEKRPGEKAEKSREREIHKILYNPDLPERILPSRLVSRGTELRSVSLSFYLYPLNITCSCC